MIFTNNKTLIGGIQGSGKTYLAKKIASQYKCFVHTPHKEEWKKDKVYLYSGDFINDFELVCRKVKQMSGKIQIFIIDEFDMIFRNHLDFKFDFTDLNTNHKHMNLGIIGITRRIQDIPARYYGTFENLCLFKIESPQTRDLLNRIYEGLGDMVFNLNHRQFEFVSKELGKHPVVMKS